MHRIATLAVVALAGCPAPASRSSLPPTGGAVIAGVKGTIEQWRQAYELRSIDALGKLYAHEPTLTITQEGIAMFGWSSIEVTLRDKLAHATQIRIRIKDVQVTSLAPGAAFAIATMTRERSEGAATTLENGALTLILRNDGEHWLIVAEHYSYNRPS